MLTYRHDGEKEEGDVIKDLTGMTFGKWKVIKRVENNHRGAAMWQCRCECGKFSVIPTSNLTRSRTRGCQSCNCGKRGEKHGMSGTKIYKTWKNMRQRCYLETSNCYKDYGGRGISVHDEWNSDFQTFFDYVSKLPHYGEKGYSIDRIDVNGNYEPGNVKWSTAYEQIHNRRK